MTNRVIGFVFASALCPGVSTAQAQEYRAALT